MRVYLILIFLATLVLGTILFVFVGDDAQKASDGVLGHQLANGMNVIVVEDHSAPVVVSQVWYRVGGSYEHDGITGISHVLEHMMFKGTPSYPAGRFSEIIAANGGRENAFTGKDYTAYFQRIASDRLELCLELEADRMRNLLLEEKEFKKEVEVVMEERRLRTEDSPTALTYERFNAIAYTNSPYRQPIIGWMQDLKTLTIDDIRRWYQKWYAPNNATLVVVGDVYADDVFQLANKYFGPLKRSTIIAPKPRREAPQYGVHRATVQVPARVPYLVMGYKTPVLKTAQDESEVYALEVLAGLLDGGYSARLTRNLVRGQQLATSVGASYDLYALHDSMFVLSAIPADEVSVETIEQALKAQIQEIKNTPPEQKEMERVIAQVVASAVYELDSSFYQAMQIGILETTGLGWQVKEDYVEIIKQVTAEQVQNVARKYFNDKSLTVAVLDPLPIEQNNNETAGGGSEAQHGH